MSHTVPTVGAIQHLPAPPGGDVNRGPSLLAQFWTEIALGIVLICMRFWSRISAKNLGWDDFFMLITLLLFLAATIVSTDEIIRGGVRHVYYLTPAQLLEIGKLNWIAQPFAIMALATGRVSIAFLLLRILGPNSKWRRWFLIINNVFVLTICALESIFCFAQCKPVAAIWNKKIPGARCWDANSMANYNLFCSSYGAYHDFVLALLPITIVYPLQMPKRKKFAICILLGLGIFAGITAAIKTPTTKTLSHRSDLTWETYSLAAWTGAQIFLLIFCGTVPTLKPIYERVLASSLGKSLMSISNQTKNRLLGRHPSLPSSGYLHGSTKRRTAKPGKGVGEKLEMSPTNSSTHRLASQGSWSNDERRKGGAIGVERTFDVQYGHRDSDTYPRSMQLGTDGRRVHGNGMV